MKRYIYLISPPSIRGFKFYSKLDQILKTNKVKYFQLRMKKTHSFKLIKIAKKIRRITKKNKVKLIINDDPYIAKQVIADGCHVGQKDMDFFSSRKIYLHKYKPWYDRWFT